MRSSFFALGLLAQITMGCEALRDPSLRGYTTFDPGEPWDPICSPWYCPKMDPPSPVEAIVLPEKTIEMDIAELLSIALSNHPLTRAAWAQARAQAFQVGVVDSAYYPFITASENLFVIENTVGRGVGASGATGLAQPVGAGGAAIAAQGAGSGSATSFEANGAAKYLNSNLNIAFLVFDFGGRDAASASARQALFSLNWSQNRTIQQVIFNVMQGYYLYINAKESLRARKSDLENAQLTLKSAEALHQAGLAPVLDVLQAKSNEEAAQLGVVSTQSQMKIALGILANALGIPPSAEFETKDLPERFPEQEISEGVEGLMELARLNRPDLAAAEATIIQNEMNVKSAISASLPTLTANVNLQQLTFVHDSLQDGHVYTGVLSLNIPIFSGFLYENQIRQAKENVRLARANYEILQHQALLDVVNSYYNFVSAKEALQYAQQFLKYSQESYTAALATYRLGTGTVLNVLTTQATLANAKSQLINARTQWATSLFAIAFSTGTISPEFVRNSNKECK